MALIYGHRCTMAAVVQSEAWASGGRHTMYRVAIGLGSVGQGALVEGVRLH